MKFYIDKNKAKSLIRDLNLSDLKVFFYLMDYYDPSGFVLSAKIKMSLINELRLSRQTISISINRLYQLNLLLLNNDKTYFNENYILC
jgi:hypothetical protein